jgi:hypothetical protein
MLEGFRLGDGDKFDALLVLMSEAICDITDHISMKAKSTRGGYQWNPREWRDCGIYITARPSYSIVKR